ncbi:MAG: transporter [Gammaproteobacteria bacterium]|nr:MAG: transporter [Gammaproteobacteria bacterium]TND05040.1 MAG: transporter [Gammaproteobacteria bacterium]
MKNLKYMTVLFLAVMLVSALGCASSAKHEGTGEFVDDTVITTKVKAAIIGEPSLKSAEINVETFKGVVQLSGFVHDAEDKRKAVDIARSVKGVKSVKDDILRK